MVYEDAKARFEFAKQMIIASGEFLLSAVEERLSVETKHKNDFVTLADKKNERFIIDSIKEQFPLIPSLEKKAARMLFPKPAAGSSIRLTEQSTICIAFLTTPFQWRMRTERGN
jgi:Archaeal fructose-1,6-bisphosphatase and related enzymes of inositol monophosphatase family